MRIQTRRTRITRRTSLACSALAGVTVVLGALAPPSAARPDIGVTSGRASADMSVQLTRTAVAPAHSFTVGPTLLAGSMGVHVDGGWLLR